MFVFVNKLTLFFKHLYCLSRGSVTVAHEPHKLEVVGSIPTPATKIGTHKRKCPRMEARVMNAGSAFHSAEVANPAASYLQATFPAAHHVPSHLISFRVGQECGKEGGLFCI